MVLCMVIHSRNIHLPNTRHVLKFCQDIAIHHILGSFVFLWQTEKNLM